MSESLALDDHAALYDAARERAAALRSEAIGRFVDAIGRGIVRLARSAWRTIVASTPPLTVQRAHPAAPCRP